MCASKGGDNVSMNASSLASSGELSQSSFMQLLVQQLKYQDPMSPMSNTQFLAQLAQFTALQQATATTQTEGEILTAVQSLSMEMNASLAHQLIGAKVSIASDGKTVSGTVSSVQLSSKGEPQVTVNGISYSLSDVTAIGSA